MSSTLRGRIRDNKFSSIESAPIVNFEPQEIIHIFLTMGANVGNTIPKESPYQEVLGLRFYARKLKPTKISNTSDFMQRVKEVEDYIVNITPQFLLKMMNISPFDIEVDKQCWVVLQLDPAISGWQFCQGEFGCTTKDERVKKRNVWLKHYLGGGIFDYNALNSDGCKIIYFGVFSRGDSKVIDINDPPSEFFNFHLEFVDKSSGIEKRLKIIFDPDVKNNGGKFPP